MALLLAHAAMALHAPPFVRSAARAPSLAAVAAPSDLTQRLISDLTAPDRLEALASCDARRIAYDPFNFWDIIVESLSPAHFSRAFGLILPTLCGLAAWGLSLTWLLRRPEVAGLSELIGPYTALSGSLLTPVSFLLVFRIGRAAARFWDARAALGAIIEKCRSAASTSALTYASTPELRDQFSRWLSVLPIAVKNDLRALDASRSVARGYRLQQLCPVLTEEEASELLDSKRGPILVLNRLRRVCFAANAASETDPIERAQALRSINKVVDDLTGAWGAMERIGNTPLPFAYVAHLRTTLVLYIGLWYVSMLSRFGPVVLPGLLLTSWALLGIEAAAVECSSPFQRKPNHLRLGRACSEVAQCVAQTLAESACEEARGVRYSRGGEVQVAAAAPIADPVPQHEE
mmetsp:Transcript_36428/g.117406  ORF Transcript_36428/g.117406 Transcript_36428/m.117406 type:complete len:405 (+) Transcript_36428:84-1298(+)